LAEKFLSKDGRFRVLDDIEMVGQFTVLCSNCGFPLGNYVNDKEILHNVVGEKKQCAHCRQVFTIINNKPYGFRIQVSIDMPKGDMGEPRINNIFDSMNYHPKVKEVSESLFKSGHYPDSIFKSLVAFNKADK
jgi:hypothetical protein